MNNDLECTRQEIETVKQQIEAAKPGEKRWLRQRLMELQILQLWRITMIENQQRDRELQDKVDADFLAAQAENDTAIHAAQAKADQARAYLDAGDLEGLREFVRAETKKLNENTAKS